MRTNKRLINDETGTNVLTEYMLLIVIMSIFFTLFILTLNQIMGNADQVIVGQELGVIANDMSNRIASFSNKVTINQYGSDYWASSVNLNNESIVLPDLVEGRTYRVNVTYYNGAKTGIVTVTYGLNSDINRSVSFSSGVKVVNSSISSADSNPYIYYDPALDSIKVVGY